MLHFFHNYTPNPILICLGPVHIYWYGLFMVVGIFTALTVIFKLAEKYNLKKEIIVDSVFWLILNGLIGARLYHVLIEFNYYSNNPLAIFKIWQGGLAIHGAIIAGVLTLIFYCRRHNLNFWQLTAIYTPGLALAQTIGRWGNYFNQELFGRPTNSPWGIPIAPANRPPDFFNFSHFHPAFLYESIANLSIFTILFLMHYHTFKKQKNEPNYKIFLPTYLIMYSIVRFLMEFIRIDPAPIFFHLRFAQWASLILIFISLTFLTKQFSFKFPHYK